MNHIQPQNIALYKHSDKKYLQNNMGESYTKQIFSCTLVETRMFIRALTEHVSHVTD